MRIVSKGLDANAGFDIIRGCRCRSVSLNNKDRLNRVWVSREYDVQYAFALRHS